MPAMNLSTVMPATNLSTVMPGLVPGIHVFCGYLKQAKTWMAGTSPAMTNVGFMPGHDELGLSPAMTN
jgi:hypothetical protein